MYSTCTAVYSRSRSILIYSAQIYSVQIQESAVTSRRGGSDSFCCTVTVAEEPRCGETRTTIQSLVSVCFRSRLVIILSFAKAMVDVQLQSFALASGAAVYIALSHGDTNIASMGSACSSSATCCACLSPVGVS